MDDKTYTIVGVSTLSKVTKFRFANGDRTARQKVLERGGHTEINLIDLPNAMGKAEAIEHYKSLHPEAAEIRVPNEKPEKPVRAPKTVTIKKGNGKRVTDAANELLKAVEAEG